jgi:hypothetical protein
MNPIRTALDRTLRLMRDDLIATVEDSTLISALTGTEVVLVGDLRNLSSHAAQCAYITAALLIARSAHTVYLAAPDVPLLGPQQPLTGSRLVSALMEIGSDLLPGVEFSADTPRGDAGLAVIFGDSHLRCRARRAIGVNAGAWHAQLGRANQMGRWAEKDWPFGAFAAGALASVEAFKVAMSGLHHLAKDALLFDALFAFTDSASVELAPPDSPRTATLGAFDCVSGGAIINAALYVLSRLPGVSGRGRVVEPEAGDLSNLNRYPLMRRSASGQGKAQILKSLMPPRLELQAVSMRYEGGQMVELGEFAPSVLIGVDDIPTRWKVQKESPSWLGIGATTHWAAMASYHEPGLGCARCLHPRDDPATAPIPTIAFVSLFAGLNLASYFVRASAGGRIRTGEQYTYWSPLRPEHIWRSPVAVRHDCAVCQHAAMPSARQA